MWFGVKLVNWINVKLKSDVFGLVGEFGYYLECVWGVCGFIIVVGYYFVN